MRRGNWVTTYLKTLLVVSVLSASVSSQQAQAYLSKIPATFSGDGRLLLIQMNELVLWDLTAKALVAKIPGLQCRQLAFLKQDGWVLCVGTGVTIYDWKNQLAVATIPPETQSAFGLLAYSRDTDRMVIQHGTEAASVWQIGKKLSPLKHISLDTSKEVSALAASPDARTLAVAVGQSIQLYDLTGTGTRDLAVTDGAPRDLLFAPNSTMLAASAGNTIFFVDTVQASVRARTTVGGGGEGKGPLIPRVFSQDSLRLVASHGEWSYPLFEVESGKLVSATEFLYVDQERGIRTHTPLEAIDISEDAEYVVGQSRHPDTVQIRDLRTGSALPDLCEEDCRDVGAQVSLLKWSPNGSKIVVAMQGGRNPDVDGQISVWDVQSRSPELVLDPSQPRAKELAKRAAPPTTVTTAPPIKPVEPIPEPAFVHTRTMRASAVSPTANLLITCGDDGLLKVWDPGEGKLLRQLALPSPATALTFSADGVILAAGTTKGEIRLWETKTWKEFPPYASRQGQINALQFLPDSQMLVIAGEQPKVQVVNLTVRMVIKELVPTASSTSCKKDCPKARGKSGEAVEMVSLLDGSPFLLTTTRTGHVVWDITTWDEVKKPTGLPDTWTGLGWKRPFVSTTTHPRDQNVSTLAVWDSKHNKVLVSLDTFTKQDTEIRESGPAVALGTSMAVDPTHQWAATRVGEQISVWNMATHAKKKTFSLKLPYHLHWTSDGKYLLVATLDRKVLVWSAETMEPAHYLRDPSVTR